MKTNDKNLEELAIEGEPDKMPNGELTGYFVVKVGDPLTIVRNVHGYNVRYSNEHLMTNPYIDESSLSFPDVFLYNHSVSEGEARDVFEEAETNRRRALRKEAEVAELEKKADYEMKLIHPAKGFHPINDRYGKFAPLEVLERNSVHELVRDDYGGHYVRYTQEFLDERKKKRWPVPPKYLHRNPRTRSEGKSLFDKVSEHNWEAVHDEDWIGFNLY